MSETDPNADNAPDAAHDDAERHCPKLGHQIRFAYCRTENQGLPCPKALDCWFELIPVEAVLRRSLSPEQWQQSFQRPLKPKMTSLLELIAQSQQATKKES